MNHNGLKVGDVVLYDMDGSKDYITPNLTQAYCVKVTEVNGTSFRHQMGQRQVLRTQGRIWFSYEEYRNDLIALYKKKLILLKNKLNFIPINLTY